MSKRIVTLTIAFLLLSCGQWVHAQEGGPVEPAVMIGLSPGQPPVYGGAGFAQVGAGEAVADGLTLGEAPPVESAALLATATVPPNPNVVDPLALTVAKWWDASVTNWRLVLSWSGSTGPFAVLTCPYPRFHTNVTTLEDPTIQTSETYEANKNRTLECFEISDGTAVTVAGQNLGYDPRPTPTTPTFANKTYWWNEEVTVSARYLDKISSANIAYFYDRATKASSTTEDSSRPAYASSVKFTIPADTGSTFLRVDSGGKLSPNSIWLQMVAPGVSFGAISGVVWASQSAMVYVSDSGNSTISEVDIFKVTPTKLQLPLGIGVTNPLISRVSDAGEFVYISGTAGATEVRLWTVSTGSDIHYANTTDTGFTRSITPVGIALLPNGSACFVADSSTGKIVKIPLNNASAIVDRWGLVTFASFPNPCGMDTEPSGAVVVGAGYATYRINPAGNGYANNGSTGSTLPKFVQVDRDFCYNPGSGVSTYSDEAFCDAYNQNPIESVAGADGSTTPRYKGAIVWATTDKKGLLLDPIWRHYIAVQSPQRIVLNNSGKPASEAAYPATNQTQDRILKLTVSGWPNRTLRLRLIDPPDMAPYAPQGGWCGPVDFPPTGGGPCTAVPPYEGNDNIVGDAYGLTTDPNGASPAQELPLVFSSTQWSREFYLKVPARYSGNNFRVAVHKVNPNTGQVVPDRLVALSGLLTTWKRVFVERDRMFRRGGVLAFDYDHATASPKNRIRVWDWANVAPGQQVVLFQGDRPAESSAAEKGTIKDPIVSGGDGATFYLDLDLGLDAQGNPKELQQDYTASRDPNTGNLDFAYGQSAGFGVLSGCDSASNQINGTNSCFYDADMRGVEAAFSDGSTEIIGRSDGTGAVPYLSEPAMISLGIIGRSWFSHLWFKNLLPTSIGNPPSNPPGNIPHNYFHLMGAGANGGYVGLESSYYDWAYIYQLTIETQQTDQILRQNMQRTITDHECGHMFDLNFCQPGVCGFAQHDNRSWWNYSTPGCLNANACLMQPDGGVPTDTVTRFCKEDLLLGDPTSQCQDSDLNPYDRSNTAIRTAVDPK